MVDLFFYKLPNDNEIHYSFGKFRLLAQGEIPHGWVISDFLHENTFLFEAIEKQTQDTIFHYSKVEPVVISHRDYQIEAQALLNAFPIYNVQKAVYSRVKPVSFQGENAEALFERLCEEHYSAFVYLASSPLFGTWIAATPELLLKQEGARIYTMALAGTHAADQETVWSIKELEEHDFVVQAVSSALQKHACYEIEIDEKLVVSAGPVNHLLTKFTAILEKPNAWEIVKDMHPTPAVCGTPRNLSLELILSREMHQREMYAGIVGFYGLNKADLFVNLRCAQLFKDTAYLYVGGGYTIDSLPDLEWEETEKKAQTLLDVMQRFE